MQCVHTCIFICLVSSLYTLYMYVRVNILQFKAIYTTCVVSYQQAPTIILEISLLFHRIPILIRMHRYVCRFLYLFQSMYMLLKLRPGFIIPTCIYMSSLLCRNCTYPAKWSYSCNETVFCCWYVPLCNVLSTCKWERIS